MCGINLGLLRNSPQLLFFDAGVNKGLEIRQWNLPIPAQNYLNEAPNVSLVLYK